MRFLLHCFGLLLTICLGAAQAGTGPYKAAVLLDAPISYWGMDEAVGATTALDSAATPKNGTYTAVVLGASSGLANLGTCGTFNGSSARMVSPFQSAFNLGASDFSVECWYNTASTSRGDIFNFKGSGGDFGIFVNVSASGSIGGYHNGNIPSYNTSINAWHHVVFTRATVNSTSTITLYVDGVSRGTSTDTQSMSSSADIVVGANQTTAYFNGKIDEVAYYGSALSAARVLAHYNAATQAATPPTLTNAPATNVYATSATLNATVTSSGEPPSVTIFYGQTDLGASATGWEGKIDLGTQAGSAGGAVSGLAQNSLYYFRARGLNSAGTAWAPSSSTFTTGTASLPAVQNLVPTNITSASANLRGQVTGIGNQPPNVTIYLGTSDGGTTPSNWTRSVVLSGPQAGIFAQNVTSLAALTTYYYRSFAQNAAGGVWAPSAQSFSTPAYVAPTVLINEIHIADDDTTIHSEFIELFNPGTTSVNLSGWYFDKGINHVLPSGTTMAPGAYLVICEDPTVLASRYGASGSAVLSWQDTTPAQYNSLSNNGETITLRDSAGNLVDEVTYKLGFPWPTVGEVPTRSMELINPGLDNSLGGNWRSSAATGPTPLKINSIYAANAAPALRQVVHEATTPVAGQTWMQSGQEVRISAKATDPDGVQSVTLQYQIVNPGDYIKLDDTRYEAAASWVNVPMHDDGLNGDLVTGDDTYSALIPGSVQTHRRLIRYRILVTDNVGLSVRAPYADDSQPNFAYFVYDGLPAWTGAARPGTTANVTYPSTLLGTVQPYHLVTTVDEHSNAQDIPVPKADGTSTSPTAGAYSHSDYLWKGALCYNGVVYDHIRYRARGGVWRFSMGKNMWKFDFNKGHDFAAQDNYGQEYGQGWKKLNFSSVIQQGDFGSRGEQGLYEGVGFRLFQLSGLPAENTQYVHFRIVERPNETNGTASQYDDDFQGLYLAIEQLDGQFLDQHDLPDGNLYKMEGGSGELNHQGSTLPSNKSDLNTFLSYGTTEQWWRDNVDLPNYYNYRAIVDCIHHYDIADGKNYFFFHNPDTNRWNTLAWDLDLTWADNAYRADTGIEGLSPSGNTTEPWFSRVFGDGSSTGFPNLRKEHRNRVREILDLLYTPEQTGMVIDELASFVYQPGAVSFVDADRAMWDYNPILNYVSTSKGGNGKYYTSGVDNPATTTVNEAGTFAGMIQRMKNYIVTRRSVLTSQILTSGEEALVPTTPAISVASGASSNVPTNALTFSSGAFVGKSGATFSAMKWRLAEVTDPSAAGYLPYGHATRRLYEADAANTWESPELTSFTANYNFPPISAKVGHTYRARVKHKDSNGRWSHWSAPVSFTAGAPDINVYLQGLVVSQVMYHPKDPTAAEQVYAQDADSFEWIELMNVGPTPLDLSAVRFTKGVDFDFANSAVTTLNPGARVVVVNKLAAFNARYAGKLTGVQVAGEWQAGDNLKNGGEQLKLSYGAGTAIRDFIYDDAAPWPVEGDAGYSIVLINPESLPDHTLGANWRGSAALHGRPGFADATTYTAWATAHGTTGALQDDDGNGITSLAEYALNGLPGQNARTFLPVATLQTFGASRYLTLTFKGNASADDVLYTVQASDDMSAWSSDASRVVFVSKTNNGDGSATYVYRGAVPFLGTTQQYLRLRLQQR